MKQNVDIYKTINEMYLQLSKAEKKEQKAIKNSINILLSNVTPESQIISYSLRNKNLIFNNTSTHEKTLDISKKEEQILLKLFKKLEYTHLFNGDAISTNIEILSNKKHIFDYDDTTITFNFSKTKFYNYLMTNLVIANYYHLFSVCETLAEIESLIKIYDKINSLNKSLNFTPAETLTQIKDALNLKGFSHITSAVAIIYDDKNVLLTKRNNNTPVNPNHISTIVGGFMAPEDLLSTNPFKQCLKRETEEELGIEINNKDISLELLFIDDKNYQPVVGCFIKTDCQKIIQNINQEKFKKESSKYIYLKQSEVPDLLNSNNQITTTCQELLKTLIERKQ